MSRLLSFRRSLVLFFFLWFPCFPLDLSFKIQETTGNPADDYPVTFVAPLPAFSYTNASAFRVTDAAGATVPAQISVLNKQWQAGYVRHLLITLKASLAANEKKEFHLRDDGGNIDGTGLTVTETANDVTVNTGPLLFKVKKQNFNLFDEVYLDLNSNGIFEPNEQIVTSSPDNGGVFTDRYGRIQKSSDVANPAVAVEENGPVRAVIRVEVPTVFTDTANMRHGWMVRIYAFAGKPFVKVEFTLKNSALRGHSWPLYFRDFSIRTRLNLGAATVTLSNGGAAPLSQDLGASGVYLYQKQYNQFDIKTNAGALLGSGAKAPGWLDASDGTKGVTVYGRYFWEMWPNGLELDTGNVLYARLLPKWDAGYYWNDAWTRAAMVTSTAGLHWLDDMQHLTKEFLYEFHAGNANGAQAAAQSELFRKNPLAVIPVSWWAGTRTTADMGGIIPLASAAPSPASTDPEYYSTGGAGDFGWFNFQGDIIGAGDRKSSCETGDIPFAAQRFLATENPLYYYQDRAYVYGELNTRLEWMGGDIDFGIDSVMQFTTMPYSPAPYCNYSWRPGWDKFGPTDFKIVAAYLPGTAPHGWTSRDAEHLWIYNVEDFYYYDGMPLVRDWYRWIGQFIKCIAYDKGDNRVWRYATRGHGHALSALMAAYKMVGDSSFLTAATYYLYKLRATQSKRNGQMTPESDPNGEGGLHVGFMTRAVIRYLEELKNKSCREYVDAFGVLEGMIQWNYNWGHYCYYTAPGTVGTASGTAMVLSDPEIWLYLHTGFTPYKTQTKAYADAKMYGDLLKWNLSSTNFPVFIGRLTQYAWENPRQDTVAPPAISDLSGQATQPVGGAKLWVRADSLPPNTTLYFAVRSFDSSDNMSALSNIFSVNLGSATVLYLTWTAAPGASYYHVKWYTKPMVENDSSMDTTSRIHFWAANAIGNDINAPVVSVTSRPGGPAIAPVKFECIANRQAALFKINLGGRGGQARLIISDVNGRMVRSFGLHGSIGETLVPWNADNNFGLRVHSGVYVARLETGGSLFIKKIVLMK